MTMPAFRSPELPPTRPPLLLTVASWIVCMVAASLVGNVAAEAHPPSMTKIEDVVRILRHKPNATPKDLAQAGEDADRTLVDLLVARKLDLDVRMAAARALGGYPGERARAVLSSLIPNRDEPGTLRAAAMLSLARIAGSKAVDDMLPWLKDPDGELRAGAARALGATGDHRACGLLADATEHEEVLEVRMAIEEGAKACDARRKP